MHYLIALSMVLLLAINSNACEVCGGTNPPITIGYLPSNTNHFIGIRNTFRHYNSTEQLIASQVEYTDYFNSIEIVGKYQLSKKWQLNALIPYSIVTQKNETNLLSKQGLGDISLLSNFLPYVKKDSTGAFQNIFTIGLGFKTPTGAFSSNVHETSNMYPGTGAFDVISSISYFHSFNKYAYQIEASNAYRLENVVGYQFGNSLTLNAQLFKKIKLKKQLFQPMIGFNFLLNGKDRIHGKINTESYNDGFVLNGKIGLTWLASKWMISANLQQPIIQNIGNKLVEQKELCQLAIYYLIP